MRLVLSLAAAFLTACGSRSDSTPPSILTVSPTSATATSRLPTHFVISGGTGAYVVVSGNPAVIPHPSVSDSAFLVVPKPVTADTLVGLSVRDDGTERVSVAVTVKPLATAPLRAQPSTVAFQGLAPNTCGSGLEVDVMVSGGTPPYSVSQPAGFAVLPVLVSDNPGRVTIRALGSCSGGSQIAVTDSVGAVAIVTASNAFPSPPTPAPRPLSVDPLLVTLRSCDDSATVSITGGANNTGAGYQARVSDSAVWASVGDIRGWIFRVPGPLTHRAHAVWFSDFTNQVGIEVGVVLEGEALGPCK
jgi:hypothetical protein